MLQWTDLATGHINSKLSGHQHHALINSLEIGDGCALAFTEVKKIIQ